MTVIMSRGIKFSLELQKNILKFGYGINDKYEGMLAHLFDRFYIVTKFMLSSVGDIKFSVYGCFSFCFLVCKSNILSNRTNIFRYKTSFCQFLTWLLPGLKKMLILNVNLIYDHSIRSGHEVNIDNFSIVGREDQNLTRTIKEALYIRVNNPSLNKNIGKYHLPHIWDEVLCNSPELKLK